MKEGNLENIHQVEAKIRGARVQREHPVFSPPRDVYCFKFLANPRNCARNLQGFLVEGFSPRPENLANFKHSFEG